MCFSLTLNVVKGKWLYNFRLLQNVQWQAYHEFLGLIVITFLFTPPIQWLLICKFHSRITIAFIKCQGNSGNLCIGIFDNRNIMKLTKIDVYICKFPILHFCNQLTSFFLQKSGTFCFKSFYPYALLLTSHQKWL